MIAAQWEPFLRLAQSVGTVLALIGAVVLAAGAMRLALAGLDRWRSRVDPEWRDIDARQRANDLLRAEGYR